MQPFPFPVSSAPGRKPGEGSGLMVNCFAQTNREELEWLRVPGLRNYLTLPDVAIDGLINPRGLFATETSIFAAYTDKLVTTIGATTTTTPFSGEQPITFARNLRQPVPDTVFVSENGAFITMALDTGE